MSLTRTDNSVNYLLPHKQFKQFRENKTMVSSSLITPMYILMKAGKM